MNSSDLSQRISDDTLIANFSDGQKLTNADINKMIEVLKVAVNENYYDIQRILQGVNTVDNSLKLNGSSLSKAEETTLQDTDTTVPTSAQVKRYIDSKTV